MKRIIYILCIIAIVGCEKQTTAKEQFTTEVINGYTPVKDQGRSSTCWAYAMLSTIETEHIMRGDSVNLSVDYPIRNLLKDNYRRYYLAGGRSWFTTRGMGQTLINMIETYGAVPYDSYRGNDDANTTVLGNKIKRLAQAAINAKAGLAAYDGRVDGVIDETLGPVPRNVFMLGAQYTPTEFARSVCAPGEYTAMTSFTHHPFYTQFVLEVADNWERNLFYNVPIDTLMAQIEQKVTHGHGVCWEGDTSEQGFSFKRGIARLGSPHTVTQANRQRAFERFETTDDHCMAIVGIAHDRNTNRYFIMKNSWGTDNPYGGLMYVSFDYVRMKTIAVYLPHD